MTGNGQLSDRDLLDVACYYYRPDKVPLLRAAVLPAVSLARGRGLEAHVERHWRFGPHLRVRLAGGGAADRAGAAEQVVLMLRAQLAAEPSTVAVSEAELLAAAETAGREELVPPPYTPLQPDNSVRVEHVDTSALRTLLGGQAAVDCRARLLRLGVAPLAESTDLLCTKGNTPAARVQLALTAMALHAGRYPPGFGGGYQSFLSHLKEFLLHHDRDGRIEARFAAAWQRQAGELTAVVARLAEAGARTGAEHAWLDWTRAARSVARPAHQRGELQRVPGYSYTDRARQLGAADIALRWDPDRRTEFSDYHQLLRQTDLDNFPRLDEFVPYRFATSVLYLLLAVLDVRPVERYLAGYLLSLAAERIVGITWRERLERRIASQAAQPARPARQARPGPGPGPVTKPVPPGSAAQPARPGDDRPVS